jgi:hypothetical protein
MIIMGDCPYVELGMNPYWKPDVVHVVQMKLIEKLSQKEGSVQYLLIVRS